MLNALFTWLPARGLLEGKRDNHTKPFLEIVQRGKVEEWEKNYPLCSFMSTRLSLSKS